jgi:UDPglucose 6-dehydrogenase
VPGTTDGIVLPILEKASGKKAGIDFGVGMNPEFLREGEAIEDFMFPDRIVIGGIDKKSIDCLDGIYSPFEGVEKVRTNNSTAEMIKYTSNSLLATMISFSNEIANVCSSIGGIDITEVMKGVHLDKRLSPILPDGKRISPAFTTYIEAGCGFGGSCFPKDVKALISHGCNLGLDMALLQSVIRVNEEQPYQILSLLRKHFQSFEGIRVAVLGLAFKPGTDDMRESPAIPIINEFISQKAIVIAYDPVAQKQSEKLFDGGDVLYGDSIKQTIQGVDAILLLTRWPEFSVLPSLLSGLEEQPVLIDGRRIIDKTTVERYEGIGL